MLIAFLKMQAQGNDFVILDFLGQEIPSYDFPALASSICDRHFGVGADGLVTIQASVAADARMVIYNSDGSRAEMCGSALRCVAGLLMDKHAVAEPRIFTDSGLKQAHPRGGQHHCQSGHGQDPGSRFSRRQFCGRPRRYRKSALCGLL